MLTKFALPPLGEIPAGRTCLAAGGRPHPIAWRAGRGVTLEAKYAEALRVLAKFAECVELKDVPIVRKAFVITPCEDEALYVQAWRITQEDRQSDGVLGY